MKIQPENTTILIPTYNEAGNIKHLLAQIRQQDQRFHIMVLDDNSPDGTAGIVADLAAHDPRLRIIERRHDHGFAQSYLEGFGLVRQDPAVAAVMTMDADFSHDPKELPAMLAALNAGADVVVGSRYAQHQQFTQISLWRRVMSRFANWYVRLMLGLSISDCTAGFIAMRMPVLAALDLEGIRTEGYGFLFELKYRMWKQGWRLVEHAVAWPERHQGSSKMNWSRVLESLRLPWKIRFGQRTVKQLASQSPETPAKGR
jgi:dolichol-phosphate mannosyltransferase